MLEVTSTSGADVDDGPVVVMAVSVTAVATPLDVISVVVAAMDDVVHPSLFPVG